VIPRLRVSRLAEAAALALALGSLLLGFAASVVSPDALSSALAPAELGATLLLVLGGAALAVCLALRLPTVPVSDAARAIVCGLRRATLVVGEMLALADQVLRRWPVAGLALIAIAIAFVAAMGAGG